MSIRFLADADLDYAIVRGVRQREPSIDFKSANEAGIEGLSGDAVLDPAAREGRVLVSHDKRTMPGHFAARISGGLVGEVIESLLIIWSSSREQDWVDQIHYLPSLARHVFR